jgi:hypothetical protein
LFETTDSVSNSNTEKVLEAKQGQDQAGSDFQVAKIPFDHIEFLDLPTWKSDPALTENCGKKLFLSSQS